MGGKFEQTKPPKPKVPGTPRGTKTPQEPLAEGEGNRAQRRAASRKKPGQGEKQADGPGGPGGRASKNARSAAKQSTRRQQPKS
jgi:hypothetical protein